MKRQKDEEGGQEWLNTYADMITLVLTFFRIIIQYFKCKPDQTGGGCVCHAEAAGNRGKDRN